jgi:hypothetical protein
MTTYAAAIAARLQGREDEDMAGRTKKTDGVGDPWESMAALFDQLRDHCVTVIRERDDLKALADKTALAAANRTVTTEASGELERVQQLERELDAAKYNAESFREQAENASKAHREALDRIEELEEAERQRAERGEVAELHELLATAYLAREVPWSDVAIGMMTISRDGTPWMVQFVGFTDRGTDVFILRNGDQEYEKHSSKGETVRVLVPYVTEEQAEGLVASELGGTEVGS